MEMDEIGDIKLPLTGCLPEDENSEINISDVIEVIQTTDPTTAIAMFSQNTAVGGGGGGTQIDQSQQQPPAGSPGMAGGQHQQQQQQQQQSAARNIRRKAYVKIAEQPASKALRFRYQCEGRSAGSIPGVNSTSENKTFPTIEIVGYKGRAVVVVSCVTKDPPYRPHPHNLVGKEGCKKGVCTLEINSETMRAVFSNLGIQCVKKKDIENALRAREEIRVDPFKTGFSHRFQPSSIDLNAVRLCFQVFLESEQKGRFTVPLPPVVSDPIYDKKAMSDLVICTLCSCSSTVAGGKEVILLCEKVAKEDISIRFFEEQDGQIVWEAFGDFQHTDVHKQTAIKFRTPRYKALEVEQPVKVFIQLRRPSDGATSEALPFDYLPLDSDPAVLKRKRQKFGGDASMHLFRHFQAQEHQQMQKHQELQKQDGRNQQAMGFLNMAHGTTIKAEPRDSSPLPYNLFGNTNYRLPENSPSPQPLSPQTVYNASTPPYTMNAGGTLISPNHQFGGGNISPMNMDINEFANYHQQQQQQQQQFGGNGAGAMNSYNQLQQQHQQIRQQWNSDVKHQMPPINNLTSTNFTMDNLLTNAVPTSQSQDQSWNLPASSTNSKQQTLAGINNHLNSNNFNVNQILTHSPGQIQQSSGNMNLSEAPNLSSLLDMDSEQLIQFNSAELSGLSLT